MKKLTDTFTKLVGILNDGHYHDGTKIGEALNMTRSAVWKAIKKMEGYGIKVDSVKGKGYALLEPLILLNEKIIKKGLSSKNVSLSVFESVDSTNNYLRSHLSKKISVCIAEKQTHGKGRLDRTWHSPFGQNISLSCAYPFQKDISELAGLSLVVSLSVAKSLQMYHYPLPLLIKWPNDLIYDNKKLAGSLIEIQAESNGLCHAIIGIGINVNMLLENEISQPWTSLRKMTANYLDRNELSIVLIDNLINDLAVFEKSGLNAFLEEWKLVDYLSNKEIAIKNNGQKICGRYVGISSLGHLLLELEDGTIQGFSSGDSTVLK
ncbi:MAG: biotin--[acetyl-CoA-carboxylase] ligase [Gammaproteobacteria bacterium]